MPYLYHYGPLGGGGGGLGGTCPVSPPVSSVTIVGLPLPPEDGVAGSGHNNDQSRNINSNIVLIFKFDKSCRWAR